MQIPGISDLLDKGVIPESLLLLIGPAGAGKSMYCRQFFSDGLFDGDYCIYVSSSLTNKQFINHFSNIEKLNLIQNSKFINPYLYRSSLDSQAQYPSLSSSSSSPSSFSVANNNDNNDNNTGSRVGRRIEVENSVNKLSLTLKDIQDSITKVTKYVNSDDENIISRLNGVGNSLNRSNAIYPSNASNSSDNNNNSRAIRVVVDSLTHLFAVFGETAVLQFVNDLSFLLKEVEAMAIFTLTTPTSDFLTNSLSSIFDGIIEMKLEEDDESLNRSIRLLSIKGMHHKPSWIKFKISDDGNLAFADQSSSLSCMLCGKSILGSPILDSEFTFDSQTCLETYKKLAGVYGSNISEIGLPSEVVDVNFFFTDIVSLSDPSLPVKKQMQKIGILNKMIGSCDAYFRTPKDKKIILATGDGMAIGFLLNPELPFQLSTQLHRKLRIYNRGKSAEDVIGIRIGLGSGPVFVVNDIKDNQNVWGPGIILARRVMDIGDNFHILLADRLAEDLITLKYEYRTTIKPIADYKIKHGQKIKLYSAYSKEFGNPQSPSKIEI
jgi:KaiC/GvpD/RAD55 family RecA-like ATPase